MRFLKLRYRLVFVVAIATFAFLAGLWVERVVTEEEISGKTEIQLFGSAYAQEWIRKDLPDVVEKAVPAVVNISSKKVVATGGEMMSPFFSDPFFRRFFGDEFYRRFNVPRERVERNLGSGVIVREDGYILTNNHLVEHAEEVLVVLPDLSEFDAEIVGTDPKSDVAVLKIDAEGLPTLEFGNSSEMRLGQTVLAIGYPFGIGQTVTMGIVSALGRSDLNLVDYEDFIQTDAAINPGNSGGALIDVDGKLIGINTAILSRTGGYQGIGFAIPIDLANSVMESILEHGRVIRGWLGVSIQDMDPQMAEAFDLDEAKGVLIADVTDDSPAMKGGIEQGDVILVFDEQEVNNASKLQQLVATTKPGKKIKIDVLRDGKIETLKVQVGESPDSAGMDEEEAEEGGPPLLAGVEIDDVSDRYRRQLDLPSRLRGVIITGINPGSPIAESGLREGDVIIEVNRQRVKDVDDFNRKMERAGGNKVLLLVYRGGNHFYVLVRR